MGVYKAQQVKSSIVLPSLLSDHVHYIKCLMLNLLCVP